MGAILYSFRRCPYAMRGRMGLKVSGLDYEHREVLLRNKPQEMLDTSPKGTVPIFIKDDGQVIDESLNLLNWALAQNDPLGWLNCDLEAANALITATDTEFKHHLDRYKYASRYSDDAKRGDVNLSHRADAESHIGVLEEHLKNGPYLLGETQTIADIAIFPFLRQFANVEPEWWADAPYPKTRDWLTRHVESDLFKSVMTKYPLWKSA
ncbi:glutathione S-transferase [Hellea sp.]|nr:glutathione S-transferase [Hellea sp.]